MKKEKYKNKPNKVNSKSKISKKVIPLVVLFTAFVCLIAYSKNSSAGYGKVSNPSVELSVEKVSKDKVKIALDNFTPVIKSLQLSLKIDGNAKFEENSINWTVTSESSDVKTHMKMSSDQKSMEIFIVSNSPLNKVGGTLDICEVNVSKVSSGNSQYTIDANVNADGVSYSYVINDTNRAVTGIDMANLSNEKLTINSAPVLALKASNSIADGNIIISKGDTFDAKNYIEAIDDEDGDISNNVTVDGKVNTKVVGSYSIVYNVADSEGDSTSLKTTVIVEEALTGNETNPVISVNNSDIDTLTTVAGSDIDLRNYITAVDYQGRALQVEIKGDYDLTTPGTYTLTVTATDRAGKTSNKEITLIVEKANPYMFKTTITNSAGNPLAGEKFNLYKVETKKRWFRANSEELVFVTTLESNTNGEISYELASAGNYVLKQIDSITGNEIADSNIPFTLTEENKGNVVMVPDIVSKDNVTNPVIPDTPSNPETPDIPNTPSNPGTPDIPNTPSNPGIPDIPNTPSNPGTPDIPNTPSNPGIPDIPNTPSNPGTPSNPEAPANSFVFKTTITTNDGKPLAGEKFNLYKVETKNRWFRANSEELVFVATLESNANGEISYELASAGNYVLKQIDSTTGNEIADSNIPFTLTEENNGNVLTIAPIVSKDTITNPGVEGTTTEGNNNGTQNGTNNSGTTNNTVTKNNLPQTGERVFYGITICIALVIVGSGVYLVVKKKKTV